MESDYERQLRESNEHLREKLAEALNILEEKQRILNEKVKKYGKNKEMGNLESVGVTWETYQNLSQMTKNSKRK